jgi:hypothetical protein
MFSVVSTTAISVFMTAPRSSRRTGSPWLACKVPCLLCGDGQGGVGAVVFAHDLTGDQVPKTSLPQRPVQQVFSLFDLQSVAFGFQRDHATTTKWAQRMIHAKYTEDSQDSAGRPSTSS